MSITLSNVETTDTFSTWLVRTNQIAQSLAGVVSVGSNAAQGNATLSGTFTSNAVVTNSISGVTTLSINSNTEIGATSRLTALGDARFRGTVEIDDIRLVSVGSSTGAANATHYFLASNTTDGSLYFSTFPTTYSTNVTFTSNVTMQNSLSVFSNASFGDSITVSGGGSFNTISVSGLSSLGTLGVSGNSNFSANVTILGRLSVNSAVSFSNTLSVVGTTVLQSISANGSLGSAGQVLTSNGSGTYWSTVTVESGGTGTVTLVNSGNGLTGGPISTSGTLSVLPANGISVSTGGVRVNAQNGLTSNTSGLFVAAANGITVSAAGVRVNAQDGLTSNTTGLFVASANGISVSSAGVRVNAQNGLTSNTSGLFVNAQNGLTSNTSGLFVAAANGISVAAGGVRVNAQSGLVSNTSGLFVNSASVIAAASPTDIVNAIGSATIANANLAVSANTVDNLNSSTNLKFWTGTQSQYDAIGSKDSNTLYFVSA